RKRLLLTHPRFTTGFAMPKAATLLLLLLFILLLRTSAAAAADRCPHQPEHGKSILDEASQSRKLLVDLTLDYDLGGPNTRHDPRKGGKTGSGGKKPWTSPQAQDAPSHI
ncbi:unnamed protein product, partial [Musa hybrid cultivar]